MTQWDEETKLRHKVRKIIEALKVKRLDRGHNIEKMDVGS